MEVQPGIILQSKPFFSNCVSWSEDCHILACFESAVHVLTPVLAGMASDIEGYIHEGILSKELEPSDFGESQVFEQYVDPSYAMPESFRWAAWSPNGLSKNYGCYLTAVTTKHRIVFYEHPDNGQSHWVPTLDLTQDVYKHVKSTSSDNMDIDNDKTGLDSDAEDNEDDEYEEEDDEESSVDEEQPQPKKLKNGFMFNNFKEMKRFQTLYCAWSPKIIVDPLAEMPAILALSHKSGDITIWSYSRRYGLNFMTEFKHIDKYVNLLQWTKWKISGNKHTAYIVSSSNSGTVYLASLTITVNVDAKGQVHIYSPTVKQLFTWFEDSPSIPTLLSTWDDFSEKGSTLKLAVSKGISVLVGFFKVEKSGVNMIGDWHRYIPKDTSMGLSSSSWDADGNRLQIYTHEGQGLVLNTKENTLSLDFIRSCGLTDTLLQKYKYQCMEIQSKVDEDSLNPNIDIVPILWGTANSYSSLYTAIAFTMKPDVDISNRTNSVFDTYMGFILHSTRESSETLEMLCKRTEDCIRDPNYIFTYPIKNIIHEALEYISNDESVDTIFTWLSTVGSLMTENNKKPRDPNALTKNVYGDTASAAAMTISTVKLMLKYFELPKMINEELKRLNIMARKIARENYADSVLQFAIEREDEDFREFDEDDIMVIQLICDDVLIQGNISPSLLDTIRNVHEKLETCFPDLGPYDDLLAEIDRASQPLESTEPSEKAIGREHCPICQDMIMPSRGIFASCTSGHTWEQCCMTMRVLSTPCARKCTSCGAKSLQPGSLDSTKLLNDDQGRKSFTDTILLKCQKCIFCGSDLMDITALNI
ncbi:transcription factor IIIC subunit delta N-term-domain-containing protein, partial [Phycomyces nitens]